MHVRDIGVRERVDDPTCEDRWVESERTGARERERERESRTSAVTVVDVRQQVGAELQRLPVRLEVAAHTHTT